MTFFRLGPEDPMGEWELCLPCVLSSWEARRDATASKGVERVCFARNPREHLTAARAVDMARCGSGGRDGIDGNVDEGGIEEDESKESKRTTQPL